MEELRKKLNISQGRFDRSMIAIGSIHYIYYFLFNEIFLFTYFSNNMPENNVLSTIIFLLSIPVGFFSLLGAWAVPVKLIELLSSYIKGKD